MMKNVLDRLKQIGIMQAFLPGILIFVSFFLLTTKTVFAAPPANFQTLVEIGSGLNGPSGFEFAPDGRIFILQRTGEIKIFKNGQLLPENFAVLPSISTGDRGLIGIAFDPDFTTNHYVYFYYTGLDKLNRLVRFNAAGDVGTDGPFILYQTTFLSEQLHVGGSIRFGPDGKIYFAVGDNGYPPNGQDLSNPHGKILRINKDGSIPSDNPFVNTQGALPEIWAYGFRNPWRFQFDSATGELYGGDVGDFTIEEINHIQKGKNYGWSVCEGPCSGHPEFVNPIYSWLHNGASAASVGGPIYRASMFPSDYQGSFFFGDYAKSFIKRCILDANGNCSQVLDFDTNAGSVVDLKVSPIDGSLWYVTYIPGRLYKVVYSTGNQYPVPNATANVTKGVDPLTVNFSSEGSSDPDNDALNFTWDFGDGTISNNANPVKTYTQKGTYTVQLSVSDGVNTSQAIPIIIQVGTPPVVTIGAPKDGSNYKAGNTINYTVSAIDGAGFDINDGAISTDVVFHHDTHIHPFINGRIGRTGSFLIPFKGEASSNTWYEIKATATDTNGLSTSAVVNIYPLKSTITLTSAIEGLTVLLDGVPHATSYIVSGVAGFIREISTPAIQLFNNTLYAFDHWSDGGNPRHDIEIPTVDASYSAVFQTSSPFTGQYFNNQNLSGSPILTTQDNVVDFDWGGGSPGPGISTDNFSARWTKQQYFALGRYKFSMVSDDGARLYIDGNLVIDSWVNPPSFNNSAEVDVTTGMHEVKMEYYENGGGALAKLTWDFAKDQPNWPTPTPIPPTPPTITKIYDDALLPGFVDWSWGSLIDLANQNQVYQGTKSVSFTANQAWGGFRIHSGLGFDPSKVNMLTFAARGSVANQHYAVVLYSDNNQLIGNPVLLANYGGEPPVNSFKVYSIPLADFNLQGQIIKDVIIQEWTGSNQPALYIDSINVVSETTTPTPTPTPTATPTPPSSLMYKGEYWNTPTMGSAPTIPTTSPDLTRNDTDINFIWNDDSPDPKINLDHFVVKWIRTTEFEDGTYRFTASSDDGIRVYIDNQVLINQWDDHGVTTYVADKVMSAGQHDIRVEYYENQGGAIAKFSFAKTTTIAPNFSAEYFDNQTLTGTPVVTRSDGAINFNWGNGSPDPLIPIDNFSARWTKQKDYSAGTYSFILKSDDGVRFWIDNNLVVDDWTDHPMKQYQPTVQLTAGLHTLKIEYYENGGGALMILQEL